MTELRAEGLRSRTLIFACSINDGEYRSVAVETTTLHHADVA